jgi:hypothetical protein
MPNILALRSQIIETPDARGANRVQHLRGDYVLSAVCVTVSALIFVLLNRAVAHWFLLPVMACGVLAGVDVIRWLRGRLDLFDPRTIIAWLAFYGFFVAPILHVVWGRFGVGNEMFLWGDWRTWLGAMGCLNAFGLLTYIGAHNFQFSRTAPSSTPWQVDRKKFYAVFTFALACSIAGVTTFILSLDGIPGIIEAYENNQEAFVGKGWLLVLAWPLAILSFIFVVFLWTDRQRMDRRRLTTGLMFLSIAGIGHFILLGWYGSRSSTIWALFWMAGIIHYRFRKLSPKLTSIGLIFLLAFMYFYGFYKEQKRVGLEVLRSPVMWLEPHGYERDLKYLLLGDLARADSNALILHNLIKDPADYNYRWGLTYAGAFSILVPRNIWADRPEFKVDAGTEAQLGKATPWRSSRVYGLSGEAMLNFGPLGVVPMFALFGIVLGWYRRKLKSWSPSDSRMFIAPFFSILFVIAFVGDSDNLVFAALTEGAVVVAAIFAASKIVHMESERKVL